MGLPVQKLDDVTFEQLVDQAIKRISQYAPEWTDYNISDPGITLLEMLAWLVEMQIFTLDQITDYHKRKYLKLLSGTEPKLDENLDDAVKKALLDLKKPYRAVTFGDYEYIALHTEGADLARAKAYLAMNEKQQAVVNVIVVPKVGLTATDELKRKICLNLDKRRLVTTLIKIADPEYVKVAVHAVIRAKPLAAPDKLKQRVMDELEKFFDPRRGYDGSGWPFGRTVYLSEVYAKIEGVDGVDCVQRLNLFGNGVEAIGNLVLESHQITDSATHKIDVVGFTGPCRKVWEKNE
jgi:hypothetical protein